MPVLRTPYSTYDCGHFDDQYEIPYAQQATFENAYASPIMMSSPGASTSSTPPKKSHARRRPEGHIPRPRNAFIIFRSHYHSALKLQTSSEQKVYQQDMSVEVGKAWKALSQEDKAPYYALAEQEKVQHMLKYPGYVCKPQKSSRPKARRAPRKKAATEIIECDEWTARPVISPSPSPSPAPSLCNSPCPSSDVESDFDFELAAADVASLPCAPAIAAWQSFDDALISQLDGFPSIPSVEFEDVFDYYQPPECSPFPEPVALLPTPQICDLEYTSYPFALDAPFDGQLEMGSWQSLPDLSSQFPSPTVPLDLEWDQLYHVFNSAAMSSQF